MERKTKKTNVLVIDKTICKLMQNYFEKVKLKLADYLFPRGKGDEPITVQCVNNMMKKWTRAIN